jgi:hypothetical protein
MPNTISSNSLNKIASALSIGVVMLFFILNALTPLIADDYGISLGLYSFFDVAKSTYDLYFDWSGRLFANFMIKFWIFAGKPFFNIANTLVYCLFAFLVHFHIMGKAKYNPVMFFAISIFLWFFVPAWGQNFLWISGSCAYLWTSALILLFLVPFRKKQDNADYKLNLPLSILFFFLGVFAGCGTENASAAVLLLLVFYFAAKIINKNKIALFEVLGSLGFFAGLLLIVLAPGNDARQEVFAQIGTGYGSESFIILKRLAGVVLIFGKDLGFMLLAAFAILTFDSVCNKKRKLNMFSCFYALAAIASVLAMLFSPTFPPRAFFIVIVFSGIALGNVLLQMEIKLPDIAIRNATAIIICCLIGLSFSFFNSSRNFIGVYLKWNERIEHIKAEKEKGNLDVELEAPIPVWDKHVAQWGLRDVMYDENKWPNGDIAKHFGLSSVKGKKVESDEWAVMWFK